MSDKAKDSAQPPTDAAVLRQRAETQVLSVASPALSAQGPEEIQQMLHELRVHQIELERQNQELRTANEVIEAARAHYFDIYNLAPVGYFTISEKGLILEANLTAATMLGMARSALVKQPLSRFIAEESQDIYDRHNKQLPATGEATSCELRMLKPDGASFWVHLAAMAAQADDGAPVCRITLTDIVEGKRAEEALRYHQALLATAEKIGRVGGWAIDVQTGLTTWTDGVYDIYELEGADRLTVDEGISYYTPASRPLIEQAVRRAIEQGEPFDLELEIITAKGNRRSVQAVGKADRARGKVTGFFQDITERRETEKKRAYVEAQLAQAQKLESLGTLAGGVAHDFNNILAVILGNTDLARQDVGPAHPAMQSLEEIDTASRRARSLVQQILAFGRRRVMDRTVLSLEPIAQQAAKLLRATFPAGVRLELVCAPDTPWVLADATQIEQLLINLGINAWHATEDQERAGLIQIRLEPRAHEGLHFAVLTVRDNGCGMDEAIRSRIFEPFFTTKPVDKGTGLGLSVAFGILQAHHASIEVHSVLGEGTAFVMHFPAALPDAALSPTENESDVYAGVGAPPALQSAGKRVLYVDDEASIVLLIQRFLGRLGYRVTGFTDPREALQAVRADPEEFDAVVTDYNMPEMSGLDVARALREVRADLPVLLISGFITEQMRRDAVGAGVREVISKVEAVENLCAALERAVPTAS